MNIQKLLYKFGHIKLSISQKSFFEPDILFNRTVQLLNDSNYNIISSSPEKIVFHSDFKALARTKSIKAVSVSHYSKRLQIGVFDLYTSEKEMGIKLTYLITIISEIIMMVVFIIIALFTSYAVLAFCVLLFFRVLVKIIKLKRISKDLISGINPPQSPPQQPG
jgi:L-cystine uptake protein TcyP (sodium:dicarboxylate symporter family)